MKTYSIGDKVKVNGKVGTITQCFLTDDPENDVNTYEITFKDGSTVIECLI